MRLWSLHPMYLDTIGLTACWREGLLAKHVLLGLTKGYIHHPQLIRFRRMKNPIEGIDTYLYYILQEAKRRNFHYDEHKIKHYNLSIKIPVTNLQLEYEFEHLKNKLQYRNPTSYEPLVEVTEIQTHPLFVQKIGDIESWEIR